MTSAERREAVRQFINRWAGRGNETQDARSYWIEIFEDILGISNATQRLDFEKNVIVDGHTKRIDVYIPETHVLIEQKSLGIALDKGGNQSGGIQLTPYEQAKRYNDNLPHSEKARWIITSNFSELWIYDMESQVPEPFKLTLADLQNKYPKLDLLVKSEVKKLTDEMDVSIKAGEIVGLLYDAFSKQFGDIENEENQKALNVLCVRLVFCLYAEDAEEFGRKNMFHDYLEHFEARDMRRALIELFKVLSTDIPDRDPYLEDELAEFPYVNGGLFTDDNPVIPPITEEIRTLLLDKASFDFDWSDISPTIFGAVFESTLNPDTRRKGGMHYTSIENIHKVIDPLFLNDFEKEFELILETKQPKTRIQKLDDFQNKLSKYRFLDPACGSGNFLTETYLSLRRLENEIIREKESAKKGAVSGQIAFGDVLSADYDPIKVSISQFYGIEINDFAVSVAKAALWIAESQMKKETEDVLHINLKYLPLKTTAHIEEGNALRKEWSEVLPAVSCSYLMGNPPFIGYSNQSKEQKDDILSLYVDRNGKPYKTAGKIDYVAGWYWKASEYIQNTSIKVAFVSTNSITQGEQVSAVWEPLYDRFGIHIDYAYRTFRWDSEANSIAHVHCVVIGFSVSNGNSNRIIYDGDNKIKVKNINPYIVDADNVFVKSRKKPLSNVSEMVYGNKPADGGYLFLTPEEYEQIVLAEPLSDKYIHRVLGSQEYINNKTRYCLWLENADPSDLRKCPSILDRIDKVRVFREASTKAATKRDAATPALFQERRQPTTDYLIVPRVSSERRRYVPIGYISPDIIASDSVQVIPNATMYEFGVMTSNVHMAWMRAVAGRLEMRYRYSKDIVYNNFPWPSPTEEQKNKIEQTAQAILDARAMYPDSSLADLYDPLIMPTELRKAHTANDKAVMAAYGFDIKMTEAECVAELMKMYQKLVEEKED